MLMHAIGVLPLIRILNSKDWIQTWYADDSSCIGKIENFKIRLEALMTKGPKWCYFPELAKNVLLTKKL